MLQKVGIKQIIYRQGNVLGRKPTHCALTFSTLFCMIHFQDRLAATHIRKRENYLSGFIAVTKRTEFAGD